MHRVNRLKQTNTMMSVSLVLFCLQNCRTLFRQHWRQNVIQVALVQIKSSLSWEAPEVMDQMFPWDMQIHWNARTLDMIFPFLKRCCFNPPSKVMLNIITDQRLQFWKEPRHFVCRQGFCFVGFSLNFMVVMGWQQTCLLFNFELLYGRWKTWL